MMSGKTVCTGELLPTQSGLPTDCRRTTECVFFTRVREGSHVNRYMYTSSLLSPQNKMKNKTKQKNKHTPELFRG